MPETIATIIAVSTDAMILFHSKDGIGVLCGLPPWSVAGALGAAGGRRSDSARQLNPIITLPASKRTGHVVAPRSLVDGTPSAVPAAYPITNPIVIIPARLAATRLPNK